MGRADRGAPRRRRRLVSAGVKHWHGATPTAAMTHIALTGTVGGKNVEWLEKVSDEQYRKR